MKPKLNQAGDYQKSNSYDSCQTPAYALDPLLPYLCPDWTIWEPAAGEGLLVTALNNAGFSCSVTDIIGGYNFFTYTPSSCDWDCIITNPPYSIKYEWLARCYELGKPFALLLPLESLAAWKGQMWFRKYGVEVLVPNKRINFKMPFKGWDGSTAQFPTAWFTHGLNIGNTLTFVDIVPRPQEQEMLW